MKQFLLKKPAVLAGIAGLLLTGLVALSFEDTPLLRQQPGLQQTANDTVPEKEKRNALTRKEFDQLDEQLDKTMLDVTDHFKKVDWDEMSRSLSQAMASIDTRKITRDIQKALSTIDVGKIIDDVRSSLKAEDWAACRSDVREALEKADKELARAKTEIKDIDKEAIEKAMKEASAGMEKARKAMEEINFDKLGDKISEGMEKAKTELKQTSAMFDEMEKDGLISSKDGFTVEYKNKELIINGKKQPESVTEKYRHYFSKDHFKIVIDKED